jgi:hypothetical protein
MKSKTAAAQRDKEKLDELREDFNRRAFCRNDQQ